MSEFTTLRITRTSPVPASAVNPSYWLRIEQEREGDLATTGDIADIADKLYDIDPCIVIEGENSAEPEEEPAVGPDEEKLLSAAKEVFGDGLDVCRRALSGGYTATARLYRSHPEEGYRLVLSAGEVVQTVVASEQLSLNIDIKGDTSVELEYPVDGPFAAGWLGLVIGASGIVEAPEIKRSGNTLYWTESVTGTIRVEFATQYDLITFEIPGIPNSPGSELGMPQDVKLLAFYHMMVFQGDIQAPAGDDTITADYLLRLCGYLEDGGTTDDDDDDGPLPEPPPPPEYGCQEWDRSLEDLDRFLKICCYPPTGIPSSCLHWTTQNPGGHGLDQATIDKYLAANPHTTFCPVSPTGADGCGTIHYHLKIPRNNCCSEVVPLSADPENPTTTSGGPVTLAVHDGKPDTLLLWRASSGLVFDNGQATKRTGNHSETVYPPDPPCPNSVVVVDDGCSRLSMPLTSDTTPVSIDNYSDGEMSFGVITLHIADGVPPYVVTTTGEHTTFANGLQQIVLGGGGGVDVFVDPQQLCDGDFGVNVSDACAGSDSTTVQVKGVPTGMVCVNLKLVGTSYFYENPWFEPMEPVWISYTEMGDAVPLYIYQYENPGMGPGSWVIGVPEAAAATYVSIQETLYNGILAWKVVQRSVIGATIVAPFCPDCE